MADSPAENKDVLEPIEPESLLQRLKLTTGKAAQFCGVSRRQLCYWTDTGIISSAEGEESEDSSRRTYDFDALHRVLLIQQALEHSPGLRRAAREVDQHLSERRRRAEDLANSIEQKRDEFLTEQAEALEVLAEQIRDQLPKLQGRADLLELQDGLEWLSALADRVLAGELILEEDPEASLRLSSLVGQAEAKLRSLASPRA